MKKISYNSYEGFNCYKSWGKDPEAIDKIKIARMIRQLQQRTDDHFGVFDDGQFRGPISYQSGFEIHSNLTILFHFSPKASNHFSFTLRDWEEARYFVDLFFAGEFVQIIRSSSNRKKKGGKVKPNT